MDSASLLRQHQLKATRQRIEILDTITKLKLAGSIKNICGQINDMDRSTVYRALNVLYRQGVVEKIIGGDDQIIYVISDEKKHYVKCLKCGRIDEVYSCPLDERLSVVNGYQIIRHSLILEGLCEKCRQNN